MASTQIFVFTVSLQPFNRFSSTFYQKSRNIFPNSLESARISIWQKTMASKMVSTQIFVFTVSLQPFNQFSSNFHQKSRNIFPNLQESARISIWRKTKWHPKWHPPRYLCLLYSSTVQPIFIKFSPKISEYIFKLIGICQNFNMA